MVMAELGEDAGQGNAMLLAVGEKQKAEYCPSSQVEQPRPRPPSSIRACLRGCQVRTSDRGGVHGRVVHTDAVPRCTDGLYSAHSHSGWCQLLS